MHVYRVTTHAHLEGHFLSVDGGWGNVPYPSAAAAERAARFTAGGDPHRIIHERSVPRSRVRSRAAS